MDFSGAQRSSHAEEYADAVILMRPYFSSLTVDSQKIERAVLVAEAQKAESGCIFHFWQSAKRLAANPALIPTGSADEFLRLCGIITADTSSLDDWKGGVVTIRTSFPRIEGWLSWWLRPTIASMTFPACSQVDREVLAQIPATANAAEQSHSLLHHAVGKDQDLIPGIKNLYLHVKELEKRYDAISGEYSQWFSKYVRS